MVIKIKQYFTYANIIEVYETAAQPQIHIRNGSLYIDLPNMWIKMPRNGRIEIEAI